MTGSEYALFAIVFGLILWIGCYQIATWQRADRLAERLKTLEGRFYRNHTP